MTTTVANATRFLVYRCPRCGFVVDRYPLDAGPPGEELIDYHCTPCIEKLAYRSDRPLVQPVPHNRIDNERVEAPAT